VRLGRSHGRVRLDMTAIARRQGLAAGLILAGLAGCSSSTPLSRLDYQATSGGYIPSNEVWMPADPAPAPLPDLIWRLDPLQMP
jgi:hypothetical protein